MTPNESTEAFRVFAAEKRVELNASTPREGIEMMLAFHTTVLGDACVDDVLLFQWGSYDWGAGKHFELNITRQFIESGHEDDGAISQLSLTYKYKSSLELERHGAGNCWSDGPADFRQFILTSSAFASIADAKSDRVDLLHSYV